MLPRVVSPIKTLSADGEITGEVSSDGTALIELRGPLSNSQFSGTFTGSELKAVDPPLWKSGLFLRANPQAKLAPLIPMQPEPTYPYPPRISIDPAKVDPDGPQFLRSQN